MTAGVALAALDAANALIALRHVSRATDAFRMVADPTTVTTVLDSLHSSLYYDVAASAVLVVLLIPLSRAIRQPSRPVRAFAWALAVAAWAMLDYGLATGPDATRAAPSGTEQAPILRAWSRQVMIAVTTAVTTARNAGDLVRRVAYLCGHGTTW